MFRFFWEKIGFTSIFRVNDFDSSGCRLHEDSVFGTQEGSKDYDYPGLRIGEGTVGQNARKLANMLNTSGNIYFFLNCIILENA